MTLTVTFKTVKGQTFSLELDPQTKVSEVKDRVQQEKGAEYPKEHQVIISAGKILPDDSTLADNKVTETGFVVVMVKKGAPAAAKPTEGASSAAAAGTPAAAQSSAPAPAASPAVAATTTQPTSGAPSAPAVGAAAAPPAPAPAPGAAAAAPAAAAAAAGDPYSSAASSLATGTQLEASITSIMEMGFPRDQVQRALRAAFNNPDRAVEYLMTGIPAGADQAAAAAAGGGAGAGAAAPGGAGQQGQPQQQQQATGPNTQPLDMFNPQAAQAQAGANAAAAGGAGGGSLEFLRNNRQFQALRGLVQNNPSILQPMLQELGKQNPGLLQLINSNQEEFLRMINEPAGEGEEAQMAARLAQELGGMGGGGGPVQIPLTEQEREAVERLMQLGFDQMTVVQAFLACDKNEELAANYLLEHGMDED